MASLRMLLAVIGGALLRGALAHEVRVIAPTGDYDNFVSVGLLAGIGLGLLVASHVPRRHS